VDRSLTSRISCPLLPRIVYLEGSFDAKRWRCGIAPTCTTCGKGSRSGRTPASPYIPWRLRGSTCATLPPTTPRLLGGLLGGTLTEQKLLNHHRMLMCALSPDLIVGGTSFWFGTRGRWSSNHIRSCNCYFWPLAMLHLQRTECCWEGFDLRCNDPRQKQRALAVARLQTPGLFLVNGVSSIPDLTRAKQNEDLEAA